MRMSVLLRGNGRREGRKRERKRRLNVCMEPALLELKRGGEEERECSTGCGGIYGLTPNPVIS